MALDTNKVDKFSLGKTNVPQFWVVQTTDNWATATASAYFNTYINDWKVGNLVYIKASNDEGWVKVTSVTTNVTVSAAGIPINAIETDNIQDDAVTTAKIVDDAVTTAKIVDNAVTSNKINADAVTNAKIADDAVSLENLDAGITPSHIVIAAGEFTTVGGDATETITATGALATDFAFCELKTAGSVARTILTRAATTDAITVVFSGDPSNDHVVVYQVLRAAA